MMIIINIYNFGTFFKKSKNWMGFWELYHWCNEVQYDDHEKWNLFKSGIYEVEKNMERVLIRSPQR